MKHLLTSLLALLVASPALGAKMPMPSDIPKSYEAECAICHMAYPPGLLSEKNWQSVMSGLNKHFGTVRVLMQKIKQKSRIGLVRMLLLDKNIVS